VDLLRLETNRCFLIRALALVEPALLVLLILLRKLKRGLRANGVTLGSVEIVPRRDHKRVLTEIERLCSGEDPDELLIKQMTAEERALFDVSIIDSLNKDSPEDRHRLRSALLKYGYDEQCARRVMSGDFSDRIRASALLSLLSPQWRETSIECQQLTTCASTGQAPGDTGTIGPEDPE
jgi:hypothetical protein